ncbi:hypothetical protein Tsubulata_032603 [Turnera subulata]|uniref:Uncharacterized protein n=1 Tax=Turnera subulata TaxID=218843 RepID=A0A9Q0G9N1_9ROSI|nr:hypothetical protein Tsubulata_032603 [Turnera subulata]
MYQRPPRSVCFSMRGPERRREWYTFDLSDNYGITCGPRSPDWVGLEHSHHRTIHSGLCRRLRPTFCDEADKEFDNRVGWAVLGNHLYCLGGGGTVLAINLFSPEEGWKREQPWAEVYDPVLDSWEPLPEPPRGPPRPEEYYCSLTAGDSEDGYLFFLDRSSKLLRYDVERKSWRCYSNLPCPPEVDPSTRRTICVGHVLYWFYRETGQLFAYDLRNQVAYSSDLVDWTFACKYFGHTIKLATLGHLGGNRFCLLYDTDPELNPWSMMNMFTYQNPEPSSVPERFEDTTLLHCLKFRVRLVPERESMKISLESCQGYLVKAGEFRGGFMV